MADSINSYPQFFTATNLEWKKLLKPDKYKKIITDSLRFLVQDKRIILYAFVIMDNHMHLIWQIQPGISPEAVQRDFLKFTAQQIKKDLLKTHRDVLAHFKVDAKDRQYQFWERNPLSIELRTNKVFQQKLDYLHNNPVKAGLCRLPEEYRYSSASFYELNTTEWDFLTHFTD
jgi:putative transposase